VCVSLEAGVQLGNMIISGSVFAFGEHFPFYK
jgi:hypothetical protein